MVKFEKKSLMSVFAILIIALISLGSCVSKAKVTYLQGADDYAEPKILPTTYDIKIQPDDQLSISISSSEKELLEPFTNKVSIGSVGNGLLFTVNKEGYIEFPVFGLLKVSGYSRSELARMIEQKLKTGGYTQDPVVSVDIKSFKVTVLGEAGNTIVRCETERLTILEAIAQAGGVELTGKRQNVLVMREQEGKVQSYRVDLSDARATLSSPVYYLKQNDVIYVEPNSVARVEASPFYKHLSAVGSVIGIIATTVSLVLIWKRF